MLYPLSYEGVLVSGLKKLDEHSIKTRGEAGDAKRSPNPLAPGNWPVSDRAVAVCGLVGSRLTSQQEA